MNLKHFFAVICLVGLTSSSVFSQQERLIITESDTTVFDVQDDSVEYEILAELFRKTKGKRWSKKTNWLKGKTNEDMGRWHGVVVRDGDISEIHLGKNNLKGKIPKSIYKLVRLTAVSFEDNELDGQEDMVLTQSSETNMTMESQSLSEVSSVPEPVIGGKNLPIWGLAVDGPKVQQIDWRKSPPEIGPLLNSGTSKLGAAGVALDDCGRLALYVLHSGVDKPYQLHIYDPTGIKLTTETYSATQALNSVHGNMELQVVRVPNKSDEWFIIYSLFQPPCLTNPPGSIYCPAKVVYTQVRYNSSGLYIYPNKREVSISGSTFIQGKAVSRTVNGDPDRHFLYLAERVNSGDNKDFIFIHRYIIDESGINFGMKSPVKIPARYWLATIAGSSIELSPDERSLAISNRNVGSWITEDIIIFDLSQFNTTSYIPKILSIHDLKVAGTGMTVRELYTNNPQYSCLRYIKNKLSSIEFSPSGRYLYAVHGGYPDNTGKVTYNTYLLQIDLQSGTGTTDFDLRLQIERGIGVNDGGSCTGSMANTTNNFTTMIQSAYDGRLYITKRNSSNIFVIPNPDDPLVSDLTPGVIDLSTTSSPNLSMEGGTKVMFMPENIDGYNYLTRTDNAGFTLDRETVAQNQSVLLTLSGPTSGFSYQVSWGDGTVEAVLTPPGSQSHIYTDKGEYPVTLTVVDDTGCASVTTKVVEVIDCAAMSGMIITASQYLCATKFSVPKITDCFATYAWNFGDGGKSFARTPLHAFATSGSYIVTVGITYDCDACRDKITLSDTFNIAPDSAELVQRVLEISTDEKLEVIASGASTFSDSWSLDHNEPELEDLNNFVTGSKGIWRNESSFLYNTTRLVSEGINLALDGTYTLQSFNWPLADLEAIPKWIKTNTITMYNSSSYETENSDVLGINSAALYDYRGQLQTAYGVNMANTEMGFTGFEDPFEISAGNFIMKKSTGNFIFNTEPMPDYTKYKVISAELHVAAVSVPLADIQDADKADIISTSFSGTIPLIFRNNYLQDVKILCKEAHPTMPDWSVIVFEKAPHEGLWWGQIRVKNLVSPVVQGTIDPAKGHTGRSSLKISSEKNFEQKLIRLEAGKTYHINAWVTVSGNDVTLPKLSDNLGIDVILRNKQGAIISTTFIVPQGKIIEGWQQLKGSFLCPEKDLTLNLKFKTGSTETAWYDDIRFHPEKGNMKGYVYDIADYRLHAILDEENFASFFYYDKEGNLYLTKKETEEGIKTITENISYTAEPIE
jgi:hypothetical protein